MNKKKLSASLILVGFSLFILIVVFSFNHSAKAADVSISMTAADLQTAGFTQVKQIIAANGARFGGPDIYFSVSDKVTSSASEAPNVVMLKDLVLPYQLTSGALFNYGSDSHDFSVAGSTVQEATMYDGRIAINFIKNNHYDIVIGPNKTKVEALASLMAAKIK